jgi:hypothetical protein
MNLGLSVLKCSVCCMQCSQIRMLLFWYQLIKTTQWDDLYSAVCRIRKSRSALYGTDRFFFADCVFIIVTCGSDNAQRTKKIRKIWRRTSHWTETGVSCIWGQVLLAVKTCCLLMRCLGGTGFEYRAIHRVIRFRFSVYISISRWMQGSSSSPSSVWGWQLPTECTAVFRDLLY